jgi:Fe-S-cluster containining protein
MITKEDLGAAISKAKPLFGRLQDLYEGLPETQCACDEPGVCCMFLPEMTMLEAMQWTERMQAMSVAELTSTLRSFVTFYLTNPARLTGCPFRDNGACSIYKYRTFGCRSYGLWSQQMGRSRTRESRKGKKALRQMWKRYGIELPAHSVEFEIDYCDKVQVRPGKPVDDEAIMDLLTQVYYLGKPLGHLQSQFEEDYHSDFSFLLTSLVFGMRKALLLKFAVIKEIVQEKTDTRLQQELEKVSPTLLRFK